MPSGNNLEQMEAEVRVRWEQDVGNWEHDVAQWKQDVKDRDARITYLEQMEAAVHAKWEHDVAQWKQDLEDRDTRITYLEQMEAEVRTRWEQDVQSWKETAAALELERKKWFRIPRR